MATQVSLFLCPSDGAPPPAVGTGPTNYAFCTGDGSNGGDATNADGAFILGSSQSVASLTDGIEPDRGGLRAPDGNRRAVFATIAGSGSLALKPGHGPPRRGPADGCRLRLGERRLALEQRVELVGRQLSECIV